MAFGFDAFADVKNYDVDPYTKLPRPPPPSGGKKPPWPPEPDDYTSPSGAAQYTQPWTRFGGPDIGGAASAAWEQGHYLSPVPEGEGLGYYVNPIGTAPGQDRSTIWAPGAGGAGGFDVGQFMGRLGGAGAPGGAAPGGVAPTPNIDIASIVQQILEGLGYGGGGDAQTGPQLSPDFIEQLMMMFGGGFGGSMPFSPYSYASNVFDPIVASLLANRPV